MLHLFSTRRGSTIPQLMVPGCSLSSASQYNPDLQKFIAILLERIRVMDDAGTDSYTPRTKVSQMRTK